MFYTGDLLRSQTLTPNNPPSYKPWKKSNQGMFSCLPRIGKHFNVLNTTPEPKPEYQSDAETKNWRCVEFLKAEKDTFPVFTHEGNFSGGEQPDFNPKKYNYSHWKV